MFNLEIRFSASGKTKYYWVTDTVTEFKMSSKKQAILLLETLNKGIDNDILPSDEQIQSNQVPERDNDDHGISSVNMQHQHSGSRHVSETTEVRVESKVQNQQATESTRCTERRGVLPTTTGREESLNGGQTATGFIDSLIDEAVDLLKRERQLTEDSRQLATDSRQLATESRQLAEEAIGIASSAVGVAVSCYSESIGGSQATDCRRIPEIEPTTVDVQSRRLD